MSNRKRERIQNWTVTVVTMTTEKMVRVGLLLEWHTELQRNYSYYCRNTSLSQKYPNYSRSKLERKNSNNGPGERSTVD